MALLRRFDPPTFARALDDWSWLLGGRPLQPLGCSMFGDVFLQGPDAIWFLDSIEGTLTPQWHDTVALKAMLDSRDGQDRFLLAEIALAAQRKGLQPGPSEILDFTIPPAIGGHVVPQRPDPPSDQGPPAGHEDLRGRDRRLTAAADFRCRCGVTRRLRLLRRAL